MERVERADRRLVMAAAVIAQAAPRNWEALVEAMKTYAVEEARTCVRSPPAELQRMQGRAQQCDELAYLFENAVKLATKVSARAAGGP